MKKFPEPEIIVSKCLGFEACRWNGARIDDPFIKKLGKFVRFRPVCPEYAIGLGVPRHPIRIVRGKTKDDLRLIQPATGTDVTEKMKSFIRKFFSSARVPDGFILKHGSPSCGMHNVKVYDHVDKPSASARTGGFFGMAVKNAFPDIPTEDEGRLKNFTIRENFLTRLYTLAAFSRLEKKMKALVAFHSDNKYLLMAYSQTGLKKLGKTAANHEKKPAQDVFSEYEILLRQTLSTPARHTSVINALMHAFGYFKRQLKKEEKEYFLDLLEEYRRGGMPVSVPVSVLKSWALRFEDAYLSRQSLFSPYPDDLVEITDSGKGRNY